MVVWQKEAWEEFKKLKDEGLCKTIHDWYYYVANFVEPSKSVFLEWINNMKSKGYTFQKVMWLTEIPHEIKLYFDLARVGVQIKDSMSSVPFFIYLLTSKDKKSNAYIMRGTVGSEVADVAEVITDAVTGEIKEKECYV